MPPLTSRLAPNTATLSAANRLRRTDPRCLTTASFAGATAAAGCVPAGTTSTRTRWPRLTSRDGAQSAASQTSLTIPSYRELRRCQEPGSLRRGQHPARRGTRRAETRGAEQRLAASTFASRARPVPTAELRVGEDRPHLPRCEERLETDPNQIGQPTVGSGGVNRRRQQLLQIRHDPRPGEPELAEHGRQIAGAVALEHGVHAHVDRLPGEVAGAAARHHLVHQRDEVPKILFRQVLAQVADRCVGMQVPDLHRGTAQRRVLQTSRAALFVWRIASLAPLSELSPRTEVPST